MNILKKRDHCEQENTEKDTNIKGLSPWEIAFNRLKKNKLAIFGITILVIMIFLAFFAPVLTKYDRDAIDTMRMES